MPQKIQINVLTGEKKVVEMTDQEIADGLKRYNDIQAQIQKEEQKKQENKERSRILNLLVEKIKNDPKILDRF